MLEQMLEALRTQWMPHGQCIQWNLTLLSMQVPGDAMIFLAYMLIPFALIRFVRRNSDYVALLNGRRVVTLYYWFAIFIALCGTTHLMGIITVWKGIYYVDALVRLITGVIALLTVDRLARANIEQQLRFQDPQHLTRIAQSITMQQRAIEKIERAIGEPHRYAGHQPRADARPVG